MSSPLINGVPAERIGITDRGLHYGDGLFETMRVHDGRIPLWTHHWQRLSRDCRRLGIEDIDAAALHDEVRRVSTGIERGVVKIIVTRGSGGRGYRPPPVQDQTTRMVVPYDWPDYPAAHWHEGVTVRLCRTRLGRNPALAGMKHLNRLEQVLARREWDDPAVAEGLMQDDRDRVICGTMTNLFIVKGGRLLTPPVRECGVAGVMRGLLLETAGGAECTVSLEDLKAADEVLLCNAVIGLWPVRRIEERVYPVGAVSRSLMARLRSDGLLDD
jgi:4-amino-4-deoxychorismate lyase